MEVSTFAELVQQLGFPIACVVSLFILLYKEMQDRKIESQERAKRDMEFTKVISENTEVVRSLKGIVERFHEQS